MNAPKFEVKPVTTERQALWDIYEILGFDTDGDPTPAAVASDLCKLVVDAAREFRADCELDEEGWRRANDALAARVQYLERVLNEMAGALTRRMEHIHATGVPR